MAVVTGLWNVCQQWGQQEESREKGKERGREGGRTRRAVAVSQEMQLCSVCLLTKMSNACLMLGNFHIPFRDVTALGLMAEDLPQGLGVQVFLFPFFFFAFNFADFMSRTRSLEATKLLLIKAQ